MCKGRLLATGSMASGLAPKAVEPKVAASSLNSTSPIPRL
jgi:hypothetical protein